MSERSHEAPPGVAGDIVRAEEAVRVSPSVPPSALRTPSVPPRPSTAPGGKQRTATLPGAASVPPPATPGHPESAPPVVAPSPGGYAITPLPQLPNLGQSDEEGLAPHAAFAGDGPLSDDGGNPRATKNYESGPPPIQRFMTPLPPVPDKPPSPEPPAVDASAAERAPVPAAAPSSPKTAQAEAVGGSDGTTRRRSRRTVRIPDDAVPQTAAGLEADDRAKTSLDASSAGPAQLEQERGPLTQPSPATGASSGAEQGISREARSKPQTPADSSERSDLARGSAAQPRAQFYSDPQGGSTVPKRAEPPAAPPPIAAKPPPATEEDDDWSWARTAVMPRVELPTKTAPQASLPAVPRPAPAPPLDVAIPAAPPAVAAPEESDVIRPIRIINVGQSVESERRAEVLRAKAAAALQQPVISVEEEPAEPRAQSHSSRPPLHASMELEAFVAPPPPLTPDFEEVDVEEEFEPTTAPRSEERKVDARGEELESFEEIEPERVSGDDYESAVDELTPEQAPKKKAPPPPPKRSGEMPAISPVPPPVEVRREPPPPPARAAQAPASTQQPVSAQTPSTPAVSAHPPDVKKRQKAWWEDLFGDDFLRTMDKQPPKVIKHECDFIEERLGVERGAVVLDLACGTGGHAVELASRGYSVVGYDLSLAMLAHAADEAQARSQRLNFLQGDMREMAFAEMFDAVYCWSTSFGYFEDEKNFDVLGRIRRALRPGGVLLLDLTNRDYVAARQPSLVWFEGEGCVCMDEMSIDFFTSRLRVKRTVMFEDGRAREIEYSIRLYALHELGKMMHDVGFKVIEVTGHPAHPGVFFGSESPRVIVLAERKE